MITFYLLRGMARESAHWGEFPTRLIECFPGSSYVNMDLPGFGELNYIDSPNSIEAMVYILKEKYYKVGNTNIFIASSLAALVALSWSKSFKNDFCGIILLSPSVKGICKFSERVKFPTWYDCSKAVLHPSKKTREKMFLKINVNDNKLREDLLLPWLEIHKVKPYKIRNVLMQLVAGMRFNLAQYHVNNPVLIVGSHKDRLVATSCLLKLTSVLSADLALHPHVGHSLTLEDSKWLCVEIDNWIKTKPIL